jgi:hypothetical protein
VITRSMIAAAVLLFCSLANADPKPTATEVFHLRSECQKIVEDLAQAPFTGSAWSTRATSNYNTEDGHCYMMVESTESSEGSKVGMSCASYSLYDAQTDDMKAHAKAGTGCPDIGPPPHKYIASRMGMVFASEKSCPWDEDHGFGCAMDYINQKMQK